MKKLITFILIFILIVLISYLSFINIGIKKDNQLKKVTLSEVAHSIFYAPQYVADALGYFKDEGLDINIVLANGADAVMASVLSGDADIGFCGPEATIYVVDKKKNIINSNL